MANLSLWRRNSLLPSFFANWDNAITGLEKVFDEMNDFLSPITNKINSGMLCPVCNIHETDKSYVFSIDLPGVSKDAIDIQLKGNQLYISGERKKEYEDDKEGQLHKIEKWYGKFQRVFTLPENVNTQKVEANYKDGVLLIEILKKEEPKATKINIK